MMTRQFGTPHDARLDAVARAFDLGALESLARVGGTNDNYRVVTRRGAFIVKFLVNTSVEDLARGLPFLERLEAAGFPALVTYLRTPDGDVFYRDREGAAVVLPQLSGEMPDGRPQVCYEVGRNLAQLHLVAEEGLPEKAHWLDDGYLSGALAALRETVGAERIAGLLRAFAELGDFDPAALPHSIIHGDLDRTNCLFDGDRLVAFLDWQDVGVGATLLDFAMTILGFCFVEETAPPWHATFDPAAYANLYAGYAAVRPLTAAERSYVNEALQYVGLTQPAWSLLHWGQYHPNEPLDELKTLYWRFGLDMLRLPAL
jgi:Ser/Thr protein kinase RdoA (MazF antagonist)